MDDQFTVDGIFQARVSSKRESKAGIFLTVEIPADDYSPALAQLRAGSLLKMGWREMLNVEVEPIEVEVSRGGSIPDLGTVPRPQANEAGISKPKKRFEDYPLSQQCAMLCDDANFRKFIARYDPELFKIANGDVAGVVRSICNVMSRSEIAPVTAAGAKWVELERDYQNWATEQKYGAIRR